METKETFNWKRLLITTVIVLVAAGATGGTTYYVLNQNFQKERDANQKALDDVNTRLKAEETKEKDSATTTKTTTLTNDQIFTEVSTAFGFTRSQVNYFRIYGQDKVAYSLNTPLATGKVAYKTGGVWKKIELGQGIDYCSAYQGVPTKYLPICTDANGNNLYMNADRTSTNYPTSSEVHYIGQ